MYGEVTSKNHQAYSWGQFAYIDSATACGFASSVIILLSTFTVIATLTVVSTPTILTIHPYCRYNYQGLYHL